MSRVFPKGLARVAIPFEETIVTESRHVRRKREPPCASE